MDTYVINLDKDVEKWNQIQKNFSRKLTRVSAVDGDTDPNRPFLMNKMMHGCLQSHCKIWQMVVDNNRSALVLEDDCVPISKNFETCFQQLLATLPCDYDVAIFGYLFSDVNRDYLLSAMCYPVMKGRPLRKVNEDWYEPGIFGGSHCYMISVQGAKTLLQNHLLYHADCVICCNKNIRLYCVKNAIAAQKLFGNIYYNPHTTLEWLLVEPLIGFGPFTIRVIHACLLCFVIMIGLLMSSCVILNWTAKIIIMSSLLYYLCIISHISAHI